MTEGDVWVAIRQRLPDLRKQLKAAVEAKKHEEESIQFDAIANKLADAVNQIDQRDQ